MHVHVHIAVHYTLCSHALPGRVLRKAEADGNAHFKRIVGFVVGDVYFSGAAEFAGIAVGHGPLRISPGAHFAVSFNEEASYECSGLFRAAPRLYFYVVVLVDLLVYLYGHPCDDEGFSHRKEVIVGRLSVTHVVVGRFLHELSHHGRSEIVVYVHVVRRYRIFFRIKH